MHYKKNLPVDIGIPYCPVDGKSLFSKKIKMLEVDKISVVIVVEIPPTGADSHFLFLQIASISQLQYGCGPNIYQLCKYFGTISSTVEKNEVL